MATYRGMRLRKGTYRSYEAEEEQTGQEGQPEIPASMKGNQSYTAFVKHLSASVTDPKAKAWIDFAFGGKNDDVQFEADPEKGYPVKDLLPTQNFIGLENSIGWTVNNPDIAGDGLKKMLLEDSPEMKPGSAIWIFEGKYIIDGHHRWSQVYAFNPDAKIVAINFKSNTKLKPQQALAAVQGVIASVLGKVPIATSKVDGKSKEASNVLKDSEPVMLKAAQECLDTSEHKEAFMELCDGILETDDESARKIKDLKSGFDNDDSAAAKVLTHAVRNCLKLKTGNNAVSGAPEREYMPQTDGGDGADKKSVPKQVQAKLTTGVDDVVLNVTDKKEQRSLRQTVAKVTYCLENKLRVSTQDREYLESQGYSIVSRRLIRRRSR